MEKGVPGAEAAAPKLPAGQAVLFEPAPQGEAAAVVNVPDRRLMGATWDRDPDPQLAAFAGWTKRFMEASPEERGSLEHEGITLATQRREAMAVQIQSDPRRALANTLPLMVRGELPGSIEGLLEERVDGIGDTGKVCALPKEGHAPIELPDFAELGGRYYDAYRYGRMAQIDFVDKGSLHGIAIGKQLAVLDAPFRQLEPGESAGGEIVDLCDLASIPGAGHEGAEVIYQYGADVFGSACCDSHVRAVESNVLMAASERRKTDDLLTAGTEAPRVHYLAADGGGQGESGYVGRPATSHTHGAKKILVFRASTPGHPLASSITDNTQFNAKLSDATSRYPLMSYGKMSLQATVTPVYNLSASFDAAYDINAITSECQNIAAANGYNLADYGCFACVVAPTGAGWAGLASGNRIWMNHNIDQSVFIHEYGHFLGLGHANLWRSTDGNPVSESHTHHEYGDYACWMGNWGSTHATRTYSINALNRLRWMPDERIQSVTASGTYTLYQNDGSVDLNSAVARGLKLSRDGEYTYWLGFTSNNIEPLFSAFGNGITVRLQKSDSNSTTLLDLNDPGTQILDAPLAVGQTFYDSAADISITNVSISGTNPNRSVQVQVSFGPRYAGGARPLTHGGIYRFANAYNEAVCLGTTNGATNNLPVSMLAANDADANQMWVATRNASDGSYSFNLYGTNKWLTVENNSSNNGTNLLQATAVAGNSQRFKIFPRAGGELIFGKFAGGADGTNAVVDMALGNNDVLLWSYNGGLAQAWVPEMLGITTGQSYRLLPAIGQRQAIETDGGNPNNGAVVRMWEWNGGVHQRWSAQPASVANRVLFRSDAFPAKSIDLNVGTGSLATWTTHGGTNQRWNLQRLGGSWFRVVSDADTAKSVDVTNYAANGAGLVVWPHHGGDNQRWRFAESAN